MKELFKYLSIALMISLFLVVGKSFAQDITFEPHDTILLDTLGAEIIFYIDVTNVSQTDQTVFVVRTIDELPANWTSALCFDLCFAPFIDSIATTIDFGSTPLTPGETREVSLHVFPLRSGWPRGGAAAAPGAAHRSRSGIGAGRRARGRSAGHRPAGRDARACDHRRAAVARGGGPCKPRFGRRRSGARPTTVRSSAVDRRPACGAGGDGSRSPPHRRRAPAVDEAVGGAGAAADRAAGAERNVGVGTRRPRDRQRGC